MGEPIGSLPNSSISEAGVQIGLGALVGALSDPQNDPQATGSVPYADVMGGILLSARLGDRTRALGSSLQTGTAECEVIDLTGESKRLIAEFEVYREAIYENVVGFFTVENALGEVQDEMGLRLAPGDEGYFKAALSHRLEVNLTGQNDRMTRYTAEVQGGQMLSSFIIVGGSVEDVLDESELTNPDIFFTHLGANTDVRR
jgi:hypothetical protein